MRRWLLAAALTLAYGDWKCTVQEQNNCIINAPLNYRGSVGWTLNTFHSMWGSSIRGRGGGWWGWGGGVLYWGIRGSVIKAT